MQIRNKIAHLSLSYSLSTICLSVAFLNAVLRLNPDSDLSLYRVIMPINIIALMLLSRKIFKKWILANIFIISNSIISLLLTSYPFQVINLVFIAHLSTIGLVFFTVEALISKFGSEAVFRLFYIFFFIFVIIGMVEYLTGIRLPNIIEKDGVIRAVMRNENDFSLVIFSFAACAVYYSKSVTLRCVVIIIALIVSVINGAKLITITWVLLATVALIVIFGKHVKSKLSKYVFSVFVTVSILAAITYILFRLEQVDIGGVSLLELLYEPLRRIITLDPYQIGFGSLYVRTDLTIFAILDIFDHYFIGSGPGNSLILIESSKYGVIIEGAKSLHNFPLQLLLELGAIPVMFLILYLAKYLSLRAAVILIILMLASVSQSVGLYSNYYFFAVLSLVVNSKGNWKLGKIN